MKHTYKWILLICLALGALLLVGCGSTPDQVNDPLSGFDVDANVPFPTRAPAAVTTPTPAPAMPTPAPTPTAKPLDWQNVPGTGGTIYLPTPKPTPTPRPTPTPGPRDEELSYGSKGNNVLLMQQRLIELGYLSGGADGKFGSKTESAVRLFQETMGLTATGEADYLTLKYLYANVKTYAEMVNSGAVVYDPTPKPSTQEGYALLQRGYKGAEVTKLQTRLIQLGYLADKADGAYGAVTEQAVKLFQKALGWEQTGVATASLQSYLYSGSAPKYSGSNPAAPAATKAPSGGYTQLVPGDSSTAVRNMQKRLKELGYFDGELGGNYLTKTTAAVKLFQKALGWEQTGVATAALQEKLYSSSAPYYTPGSATPAPSQPTPAPQQEWTLKYGDSGETVRRLQQRLIELGYLDASATGNFLGQTEGAILLVQEQAGTKKTGVVTEQLYKFIFSDQIAPYESIFDDVGGGSSFPEGEEPDRYQVILQPNDTGEKVRTLQQALKELGYFYGEPGGNYLTQTTAAVQALQSVLGYEENGIATYAFMERALDLSAPSYEQALQYGHLHAGDTGEAVYDMQLRLVELGFFPDYDASIAGKFTMNTLAAVQLAQQMRGMACIDDFASAEFQAYLFSDAAYYNSYIEFGG
ncbi:MAG: peptidoglycan-binding protein [Eubacteriales bacterium]|nr:peptidoglycan-binding protein [Eubacteriales bacterium]